MKNYKDKIIMNEGYAAFVETVFQMVSKEMGEQFRIRKECANKNNDTIRWGVCIFDLKDISEEVHISPTIYLEEFYEKHVEGCELTEIVRDIIQLYYEVKSPCQFNFEDFAFDNMKDKICFKLIHQHMNRKVLEGMPHREFCDLAVTYYVQIIDDERGIGTIPVNNSLMMFWNVDENILWELAYKNTRNLFAPTLQNIKDAIYECTGEEIEDGMSTFTLSNERRHFGAASILYEETLHNVAETLKASYFLLPSSVHEWFILVDDGKPNPEYCDALVHFVNRTQLSSEEILSDHAYYYDREQRKIYQGANFDKKYGKVWISRTEDCGENEGGFYCRVYDDEFMDNQIDDFCIHPYDCDCTNDEEVEKFIQEYSRMYQSKRRQL